MERESNWRDTVIDVVIEERDRLRQVVKQFPGWRIRMTDGQSDAQSQIDSSTPRSSVAACRILAEACERALPHVPCDVERDIRLALRVGGGHSHTDCDQRGCRMAVELAHRIRLAIKLCEEQGYRSVGDFLRKGLSEVDS